MGNTRIAWRGKEVHFATIKKVRKGMEFVVDYGPNYWAGLKNNTKLAALQKAIRTARSSMKSAASPSAQARWRRKLVQAREALRDWVERVEDGSDSEDED